MKVGTDGVLLGAWSPMEHRPQRILDVGTGTGLIALMAAQRGEAWGCRVDAVEIDALAAEQARTNFAESPWADRLRVYHTDIQGFTSAGKYNLVISNPPFFTEKLLPPDAQRAVARHTSALDFDDLARCAAAACDNDAIFAVILPAEQAAKSLLIAAAHGFHLHRRLDVRSIPTREPHRTMLAFGRSPAAEPHRDILTIEEGGRHLYSPSYRALTRDFYLKF